MERHAFLIIAHKNIHQLMILLKLLDDPRNDLYVHIDTRTSVSRHQLESLQRCTQQSNLQIIRKYHVTWGSDIQVKATLMLLQYAAQTSHSYYHLLSGQDLPLVSNDVFHSFFAAHNGQEFVTIDKADGNTSSYADQIRSRIMYYYPFQRILSRHNIIDRYITIPIQQLLGIHRINYDFCLAKGDQWFSITEQFVHCILSHARMIQQQYSCTYCADELFIQSTLIQSPFIKHHTNDCLRFIDWDRGAPYTFKSNDFDELMHSKKLIARKFDESIDPIIIDKIYRKLQHKQ